MSYATLTNDLTNHFIQDSDFLSGWSIHYDFELLIISLTDF